MTTIYEARGGELLANTITAGHQDGAEVAFLTDGRFVVAWRDASASVGDTSGTSIRGRVFNSDGSAWGAEFLVNTGTASDQWHPTLTALAGGGFAIGWTDTNTAGDGSGYSVKARTFGADGLRTGGEFLLNTSVSGRQEAPSLAALADGGFVATWHNGIGDGSGYGIKMQRFDAAGAKLGGEVLVNTTTYETQINPIVASLADGGFVITWQDRSGISEPGYGIVLQRFAADGSKVSGEWGVNMTGAGEQERPVVAGLSNGGFVVAWTDASGEGGDTSPAAIRAQVFGADGLWSGEEILVNNVTAGSQSGPFVAALPAGGFAIAWTDASATGEDTSGSGVKVRFFDETGAPVGDEWLVNSATANSQFATGIAADSSGVIVTWADLSGAGGDASGSGIKFQRFIPSPATDGADGIFGTEGRDTIHGLGGDDDLFGLGGNDRLDGGEGDDGLEGGADNDTLVGGGGGDGLFGGEGADLLLGGDGDDNLEGEGGNDRLEDGAGSDSMMGGEGDDEFFHVAAAATADEDVAVGGGGADTLSLDYRSLAAAVQLDAPEPDGAGGYSGAVFTGTQFLFGFSDVETLLVQGSSAGDTLVAGGGNDSLTGHDGDDRLEGGGGNDLIDGGGGGDVMIGGAGDDQYWVNAAGDQVSEAEDGGADTVWTTRSLTLAANVESLRGLGTSGLTLTGNAGDNFIGGTIKGDWIDGGGGADRMEGGAGSDTYRVDHEGDVVSDFGFDPNVFTIPVDYANIYIATYSMVGTGLENITGFLTTGHDFTGSSGDNQITGNAGDDRLDGGAGRDTLTGAAGNDIYVVDHASDRVQEGSGGGIDEVLVGLNLYELPAEVENGTLTILAFSTLYGNALNNVLRGTDESETFDGRAGADTMIGGLGGDWYHVDNVGDVVTEAPGNVSFWSDKVFTSLPYYEIPVGVELLEGTGATQTLVGSAGDEWIMSAGGGDTMIGRAGSDLYYVEAGDSVVELAGEGTDMVRTTLASYTLPDHVEELQAVSFSIGQTLIGNALDNRIIGTLLNNRSDTLDGGLGADNMRGLHGSDIYYVDNVGDVVTELLNQGIDEVRTGLAAYTLGAEVENLTGLSTDGQALTGNGLANVIAGGAGNDAIEGLGGNDTLSGGAGDDDLFGGAGNDVLNGFGPGFDDFHGGDGNDTITLRQGAGGSWVNAWGDAGDDRIVVDQLVGRATVEGGDGADTIVLIDTREAILTLGAGADVVDLSTFATGAVNATVRIADFASGAGGDRIEFSQWLTTHLIAWDGLANPFRTGHLRLIQYGADVLLQVDKNGGGNGYRDLLVFANGSVTNFTAANLDGLAPPFVTGTGAAETFTGTLGHDIIIGGGGNDLFLMQHGGRDWVFGDEGNDTFYFGPVLHGNVDIIPTRIQGGAGSDTLVLLGNYSTLFVGGGLSTSEIAGVETFKLLSGDDSTYAPAGYTIDIYDIMLSNGAIPPGETLTIDAAGLKVGERTRVNGRADLNANLVFLGGAGADEVYGTGRETRLSGGGGDDQLYAGRGDSVLDGGDGDDKVTGGAGDDLLQGGAGADRIYDWSFVDGGGSDRFEGGAGNDYLSAIRDDNDIWASLALDGGAGDDEIVLYLDSGGLVTVDGGDGNDLISLARVLGNVTITLGAGQDQVGLSYLHGLNRPGTQTVVTDFVTGDGGDRLDWALMLKYDLAGYAEGQNPFVTGHARLVQDGADTLLEIDKRSGVSNLATVRFQDHQVADFNTFNMGGFAPRVSLGSAGADVVMGTAGADRFDGLGGADLFRLEQGGADIALGGAGNDAFVFGSQLTALDQADGGDGKDQLGLQGNYNLVLGAQNLVNVETLALLPGSDARFGDTSGALYSYNLTTVDANVAAGQLLNVNFNTLRAGENVVFNGSAETNGAFFFFAGLGIDQLRGGAGGDGFFFGTGRFTADDRINGGSGADQVGLRGDYADGVTLQAATLVNVETLAFLSAADTRFGGGGTRFGYFVTSHDGNVAAGQRLSVNGAQLMTGESMRFDGRAELDGTFRILAGKGDDILTGGSQADFFYGNFGKDVLEGRSGADTFLYRVAGESTGLGFDQLVGFDHRVDRIDLPVATSFVGYTGATVGQASFDADLAAALQTLGAGQARIVNVQAGDMAGRMFAVADGNGTAGYQAGQDFVIELLSPPVVPVAGDPFFI